MTTDQVKQAIGYVRISKDEGGYGLSVQEQAIRQACALRGWELLEVCRDEGVSGAVPWQERPGLSRALSFLSPSQRPTRSKSAPVEAITAKSVLENSPEYASPEKASGKVDSHFSAMARKNQGGWRAASVREFAASGRRKAQISAPAQALVVAKVDRLSRSVKDFADLVDISLRGDWSLVVLSPELDFSTSAGRLMANLLGSFAQFEREMIAQRTREALAEKRRRGWSGKSSSGRILTRPGRPTEVAEHIERYIWELRRATPITTIAQIKDILDGMTRRHPGWAPPRGKNWPVDTIRRVIRDMPVEAV